MERQRRRDTKPELALRRLLHQRGLRYRVDRPALAGSRRRHDLVFLRARTAVEVRGCFWHGCPDHGTAPKANGAWWASKLAMNAQRDANTASQLEEAGWALVVVWEHEDPGVAAERVATVVASRM
jgi:DNA mismatch endonuclease, patch repair protein